MIARIRRLIVRRLLGPGGKNDGFNLVILMVMITVMNIVVARSLPLWSTMIQRDKELEYIFRGLQYAEAIRVYQSREYFGTLPTKLEDLMKKNNVGRRAIRQLWDNPLVDIKTPEPDGEGWIPVIQNQNQGQPGGEGSLDGDVGGNRSRQNGNQQNDGRGDSFFPEEGDEEVRIVGPFNGVRSKVKPELIERAIPNWQFTIDLFQPQQQQRPGDGRGIGAGQTANVGGPAVAPVNAADIGRVLPGQGATGMPPGGGSPGFGQGQGFDPSRPAGGQTGTRGAGPRNRPEGGGGQVGGPARGRGEG